MKDNSSELGHLFWQFEIAGVPLLPRLVTWGKWAKSKSSGSDYRDKFGEG